MANDRESDPTAPPLPREDEVKRRADRAWAQHAYAQLLIFRRLTLREKIEALEAMSEVAARIKARPHPPQGNT
jgi:hypothetical protein